MTNFHGFCSYPHGGWVMAGLIFSCSSALAATMWGVSSCRFMFVDFTSDRGDFQDLYLDPTADGPPVRYRTGAGLFTWLEPFDPSDWSQGSCLGYNQLQLDDISDHVFETARIFAVASVLAGVGVTIWTFFLACISLNTFQIRLLCTAFFILTISTGLTFIIFQANFCDDLGTLPDIPASCTLDQGGLVVIAGSILWCVAFLITLIYIKPPHSDMGFNAQGEITNAFDERMKLRKKQIEKAKQERELAKKAREQRKQRTNNDGGGGGGGVSPKLTTSTSGGTSSDVGQPELPTPTRPPPQTRPIRRRIEEESLDDGTVELKYHGYGRSLADDSRSAEI